MFNVYATYACMNLLAFDVLPADNNNNNNHNTNNNNRVVTHQTEY